MYCNDKVMNSKGTTAAPDANIEIPNNAAPPPPPPITLHLLREHLIENFTSSLDNSTYKPKAMVKPVFCTSGLWLTIMDRKAELLVSYTL